MATPGAIRAPAQRAVLSVLSRAPTAAGSGEARSTAQVLEAAQEDRRSTDARALLDSVEANLRQQSSVPVKSFRLHIGGDLKLPTADARKHSSFTPDAPQAKPAVAADPFESLPFKGLADRLGEAFMPVVQAVREEKQAARMRAKTQADVEVPTLPIPHFLPITRWATQQKAFQSTFIAEEPKQRKKARLSWYHPDDTMVPRGWWKMGLLEDLKYYRPFSAN